MTITMLAPVRKSVTVNAPAARAFQVFTAGFDTWWPRSHHIGKAPMKKAIIEERAGGRCYSEQTDGTECDWGSVLVWEPPHRLVIAWQITPQWQFEPDIARASEVEVRFTPEGDNVTRVDLEHRRLERHGAGADAVRSAIDSPNGWSGLMQLFAGQAGAAAAGALTDRERAEAVRQLEAGGRALAAVIGGLTAAQWTFKPAADRWSIAECLDHMVIVEERVLGRVNALAAGPAGSTRALRSDEEVASLTADRSQRVAAPAPLQPSLRWPEPRAGVAAFEAARQRTIDFVRATTVDLRARCAPHPLFGEFDAYQWLLLGATHSMRHVAQIEEIKVAPQFPTSAGA
jgi:uncharacterized protein YndB with AHSA1/START domain